jgi:hypothetical protein
MAGFLDGAGGGGGDKAGEVLPMGYHFRRRSS